MTYAEVRDEVCRLVSLPPCLAPFTVAAHLLLLLPVLQQLLTIHSAHHSCSAWRAGKLDEVGRGAEG